MFDQAGRREIVKPPQMIQKARAVRYPSGGGGATYIAQIDSNANAGGFYNGHLQTFDATDWKTTTNPLADTGDSIEIFNLIEAGNTNTNFLVADDLVSVWQITDDEDNSRWVCNEMYVRKAKTQAAAAGASSISVKLFDRSGSESGSAFNVFYKPKSSAPNLNTVRRRLASGDYIWVTKGPGGVWEIVDFYHVPDTVSIVNDVSATGTILREYSRIDVEVLDDGSDDGYDNIDLGTVC